MEKESQVKKLEEHAMAARLLVFLSLLSAMSLGYGANGALTSSPSINHGVKALISLEDAISLGMRSNRDIKVAYLQRVSQKFNLYVSEGKFFPKLTFTSSYLNNITNDVNVKTKGLNTSTTMSFPTGAALSLSTTKLDVSDSTGISTKNFTLTQPLLKNGGIAANTASVRIARIDEQIYQWNLRAALSQAVVKIVYSFRELLRAQEQRKIAESALRRARELYEVNVMLISMGRMAEVERIQTEADVANQEFALEEAMNQIDATRLALLSLLALDPATELVASGFEPISLKGYDVSQALAVALESHPEYLVATLSDERAQISLDYAKNQRLWDISLVAGQSRVLSVTGSSFGAGLGINGSYTGVQITVPIGDRTLRQSEVQASVDKKTQILRTLDVRQALEQRIRDAVRNVQTRLRQFELAKKARELTALKLDAENRKLKNGRSSNFQVLVFEGDLRNSENTELNAQISYLNAVTDLDDRMGTTLDTWKIPVNEPTFLLDD